MVARGEVVDGPAKARREQPAKVLGQGGGRQGGVAHREVEQGFAEDGVLKRGVGGEGAHGGDGFPAKAGNAVEGGLGGRGRGHGGHV